MKRKNVNVLVIDQATINTSYVILNIRDGNPFWVECSKILLTNPDYSDRILELYNKIDTLIVQHSIEVLVLEQVPPIIKKFPYNKRIIKIVWNTRITC